MRRVIIVVSIVVVAGGLTVGMLLGRSGEEKVAEQAPSQTTEVSALKTEKPALTFAQIQDDLAAGAKFYDVRRADEFAAGHFAGAENWPVEDIEAGKLPELPHNTKIYLHCRTGVRSARATEALERAGFTNVVDLHGLTDVEKIGGELAVDPVNSSESVDTEI